VKELYKTVWEIKQRVLIDMAADRGAYICQCVSSDQSSLHKYSIFHVL
jgi:hypothetical protein